MTKISEYPIISNPTEDDILIGTDVNSSDVTKNFSIGSIISLANETIKPYKVYTALLIQQEDNDPVATILENTLGEIPVWTRDTIGNYYLDSISNLFTTNKTFTTVTNRELTTLQFISIQSETQIYLEQINRETSDYTDSMVDIPIEIRVYN
jgi:hypothetical protein